MKEKDDEKISILSFAGNYKYLTILGCILSGISAILALVPYLYIWKVVYEIFMALPNINNASNIAYYGWMAVAFSVGAILIYFIALMCTHLSAFRVARNMRSQALHHIVKLPLGYFTENGSGKLRRIIDESSGQTETFLAHQLPDLVGAIVTPIAMLVLLLAFDWRLGIISLIPIIISFVFLSRMMGDKRKSAVEEYQNALEDMNNEAVEYIRGIPVVKTFGQSIFSFKNFHDAIMRYTKWTVNYTVSLRIPMCNFTVAINGIFVFLIPAGILLIASAVDYKAFLLNFIFYIIFTPIITIMVNRIMFMGEGTIMAKDSVKRVWNILNEETLNETKNPRKPKNSTIEFNNVSFTYKDATKPAIKNLSFKIKEGSTVAFVGPSGGGKTTVASLIPRFWDVDTGSITIGGADVRNIKTKDLMNMVSFVFQETNLFKESLFENIRLSKPNATREEVLKAAKAAQCEEIFEKFPDGMDTIVGTKGVYLSGGEAQRIALARAILKDAPIVLLDEATAFADPENEYQIQLAFENLTKGKTVLMIAHRLSTIQNSDCIMVLKDGEAIEKGTHSELIKNGETYASMWKDYQSSITWRVENSYVENKREEGALNG
ncbi:ABC transporter ATP-binding protein [Clostridium sp. CMCC3677]|uniref:ABC transporter ATP-binding protein n=1 Tax=Clostridium sp. CMCC3677 TaxID=2949963 RepID=UPI0013F01F44|nr:ABC transporter ATP-binding protein [Clostridium sp. CMCC3677]NFG61302.1 ABC transporter ATP-binding protein [Clostridium botulinum]NFQ09227.1 ABC transporter ATP-binding protein [Clostridium botulinum]